MTNFKKARIAKDLSQKEIAFTLEVSQPTVSAWESGAKIPAGKNLIRLCDLLDVSADYLLGIPDVAAIPTDAKENAPAEAEADNPDIRMIARAGKKLSAEQAETLRKYAEFMWPEAFEEE